MLTPLPSDQWDCAKAAHLLNRAGFGGAPAHIDSLVASGMAATVRYLVDGPAKPTAAAAPEWARPRNLLALRGEVQQAALNVSAGAGPQAMQQARQRVVKDERREQYEHLSDLIGWWLERMRESQDPLEEKMTLFWHGHFATSAVKVKDAYLMWQQNQTFRDHARGNFGVLVKAISRDPAMIDWLDLRESKAAHPNENFAREVMELFTLGEGNYTEKDVTEGARAFTGYRISSQDESFRFDPGQHDNGSKQFLGRSDVRDGDQAIDAILAQPACARYIARKLWTFFAYENPSDALVETLAATMRANRYEMRPVLHQLFTSAEFYSVAALRTQIKSPVQWVVQTARELEITLPGHGPLQAALRQMGQVPFNPPSVKGWDGGKAWISTATLLARYNLAGNLLGTVPLPPAAPVLDEEGAEVPELAAKPSAPTDLPDLQKLAPAALRADPAALVKNLAVRLFHGPPTEKQQIAFLAYLQAASPDGNLSDATAAGLLHLMMSTPHFQLC